jgi:hypothetical protein
MNEPDARSDDDAAPPSVTFASGLSWTRVSLPRLLSRIGKACFALGALGALSLLSPDVGLFGLGSLLGFLAWPLFIVSYILSLTQTSYGGGLTASSTELVVLSGTRRKVIPVAKIAGALVVEREVAGGIVPTVEIEMTNGDVLTARTPDPGAPHALTRALGFGPGGKRVRSALAKPTRRLLHPLLGVACYVGGILGLVFVAEAWRHGSNGFDVAFLAYPIVTLLLYETVKRIGRSAVITVGDDGIVVRGVRRRFIGRRDIAFATGASGGTLSIEEHSGKRTVVSGALLDERRLAAVTRLIEERAGAGAATADRFHHYERAGREVAAWRAHLARAMNDTSYRQNAATVDEAASVLRSAEATPEQRVGAALALRVAGQPPARIRVAAVSAADDRMREALEAVADADADDDLVIEKALKRLQP